MAPPLIEEKPLKYVLPIRLDSDTFELFVRVAKQEGFTQTALGRKLIRQYLLSRGS